MNGLIMEVNDSNIVIMTKNGEFKKIRKPSYAVQIGMEYTDTKDKKDYSIMTLINRRFAVAILAIVLILPGTFGYAYFKPAGYVNVDINPSLEITFNMFNRVIDVRALNTDGEIVKGSGLNINNDKLVDGIETIVEKAEELGYIKIEKESHILITVTNSKKAEEEVKSIKEDFKDKVYLTVSVLSAEKEEHEEALSRGVSTAEIVLDRMIESDEELDDDIVKSISKFKTLDKKLEEKEKENDKKFKEKNKDSDDKDSLEGSSDNDMEKDSRNKNKDESNEVNTNEIKDKSNNGNDSNDSQSKDLKKSQPSNNNTKDKSSNNNKNSLDNKKDKSNVEKSSNTNNSNDKKNQDGVSEKIDSVNSEVHEKKNDNNNSAKNDSEGSKDDKSQSGKKEK